MKVFYLATYLILLFIVGGLIWYDLSEYSNQAQENQNLSIVMEQPDIKNKIQTALDAGNERYQIARVLEREYKFSLPYDLKPYTLNHDNLTWAFGILGGGILIIELIKMAILYIIGTKKKR